MFWSVVAAIVGVLLVVTMRPVRQWLVKLPPVYLAVGFWLWLEREQHPFWRYLLAIVVPVLVLIGIALWWVSR